MKHYLKLKHWLLLSFLLVSIPQGKAQQKGLVPETPNFAVKTNILSDVATTFNLGFELKLNQQFTLDLSGGYNPWTFSDNKKMKHVLVQPELRYWLCESFNGTFVGIHAHWGKYNVGGIGITDYMKEHRFQGWLAGGGVSIGHQWILSSRFSLEAVLGLGYAYMDFETFECHKCGDKLSDNKKHYLGPTKATVSLIYFFK